MSHLKSIAKDWLPPAVLRLLSSIRKQGIRFEGEYATWEEAMAQCTGYDAESILHKVLDATLKVKRGEAAFERDSVLFYEPEYVWPVLSGLLWVAAQHKGRLNVLDFGGALGSSYFQHKNFLKELPDLRWNVVEQEHYVKAGTSHIQDEQIRFYSSIEECLVDNNVNVVLLSSVLQYLPQPYKIMEEISNCTASQLIIDRTPFSKNEFDLLTAQHVSKNIYEAIYPSWIFSEPLFSNLISPSWKKVAATTCPESQVRTNAGVQFSFKGMLYDRKT